MLVNPRFIETLNDPEKRFTLILGSGFHKQALQEESILSSWEKLLKRIDSCFETTKCYSLDFEQLVIRRTQSLHLSQNSKGPASKVEEAILNEMCFDLKCEQE